MIDWKTREIGARQGANHSQVRPRTAEQGPRSRGCDPVAGCKRTEIHRVLIHTYAVASPEGPLLRAPVRTPGEDSQHSMAPILVGFSAANWWDRTLAMPRTARCARARPCSPRRKPSCDAYREDILTRRTGVRDAWYSGCPTSPDRRPASDAGRRTAAA